ncbi:MAG: hypothetical protein CMJ75_03070 [Planctomycetaceae bacterium]|nr:hypothetical protein [Planctomycetaceae bacterium]
MALDDAVANDAATGIGQLRAELARRSANTTKSVQQAVTSGCLSLDDLLPDKGFARGTFVEWLGEGAGSGAGFLALVAAREACREDGVAVVVDTQRRFYPPAAAAWGLDLSRLLLVRPENEKDMHWAVDQALRCPRIFAVLAWPQHIPNRIFRRWQLSAESGGCLGLLVRPATAQSQPSWAETRLRVIPRASQNDWQLTLEILRCRGGLHKNQLEIVIDEQTGKIQSFDSRDMDSSMAIAASVAETP